MEFLERTNGATPRGSVSDLKRRSLKRAMAVLRSEPRNTARFAWAKLQVEILRSVDGQADSEHVDS